jgi:hypothetical protein
MTSNDVRLQRLERLLEVSSEDDPMRRPIDPTARAILDELESMIGGPDDPGPPRGNEFLELGVARGLERRGYSTAQIPEELPQWMTFFRGSEADIGEGSRL